MVSDTTKKLSNGSNHSSGGNLIGDSFRYKDMINADHHLSISNDNSHIENQNKQISFPQNNEHNSQEEEDRAVNSDSPLRSDFYKDDSRRNKDRTHGYK
jgi:hypothetical protein